LSDFNRSYWGKLRAEVGQRRLLVIGTRVVVDRPDGQVLLQLRHDLKSWSLPGGNAEEGESIEETATREVLEETGLVCERWYAITACRFALQREDAVDYFFLGLGAHEAEGYKRTEHGTVRFLPRSELLDLVKSHRFDQTAALSGVYIAEKLFGIDLLTADLACIQSVLATSAGGDLGTDNGSDRARPNQQ